MGIHTAGLVGVDVVHHDGDAVVLAAFDLGQHLLGIGLSQSVHFLKVGYGLGTVGHHGIPLVIAVGAFTKGLDVEVAAIGLSQLLDLHQLIVQLVLPDVALVDVDLHGGGGQNGITRLGGQLVVADEARPHVTGVAEGIAANGLQGVGHQRQRVILHIEEDAMAEGQLHRSVAISHGYRGIFQGEIGDAVSTMLIDGAPAHPVLQVIAGVDVRVERRVLHIHIVSRQAPGNAFCPSIPLIRCPFTLLSGDRNRQGCMKRFLAHIQSEQVVVQRECGCPLVSIGFYRFLS